MGEVSVPDIPAGKCDRCGTSLEDSPLRRSPKSGKFWRVCFACEKVTFYDAPPGTPPVTIAVKTEGGGAAVKAETPPTPGTALPTSAPEAGSEPERRITRKAAKAKPKARAKPKREAPNAERPASEASPAAAPAETPPAPSQPEPPADPEYVAVRDPAPTPPKAASPAVGIALALAGVGVAIGAAYLARKAGYESERNLDDTPQAG